MKEKPDGRQHITEKIHEEAKRILGVDINISAHNLRHSRAMDMVKRNLPLNQIRDFLGHEKSSTTAESYLHGQATPEQLGIKIYKRKKSVSQQHSQREKHNG